MPNKKVLVVDDEEVNRALLEMTLEECYDVKTAHSGASCLELVGSFLPDLILMDINMPGMTGLEACQLIKSSPETKSIPVVFVTALEGSEIKAQTVDAGGLDFFTKPIDPDELLTRIQSILGGKG